jgi:hypothetical protein
MTQSRQEAEHLMEQQHYPPDYQEEFDEEDTCERCGSVLINEETLCDACIKELRELEQEPEMKLKIFKYPLTMDGDTTLELPRNAQILSVGAQNSQLYLWALVDTEIGVIESRYFRSLGTGWPTTKPGKFIGTVFFFESNLVLHVFEVNL